MSITVALLAFIAAGTILIVTPGPDTALVLRTAALEAEILNLAVEPRSRRQGVARALLGAALEVSRAAGATLVFLEVRESNAGAIGFYQLQGFQASGRRRRYYHDPPEDALVLSRVLD